jgi:hypothetical protein
MWAKQEGNQKATELEGNKEKWGKWGRKIRRGKKTDE